MTKTSYNKLKDIEKFYKRKNNYEKLMMKRRRRTFMLILLIALISVGSYVVYSNISVEKYSLFLAKSSDNIKVNNKLLVDKLDTLNKDIDIEEIDYKWSGELTEYNVPKRLVVHHAATKEASPEAIHKWHIDQGFGGIGYHYYIKKDGTIYKGRDEKMQGAHAINENSKSIGVCLEGNYEKETPPKNQIDSLVKLGSSLIIKYNMEDIVGHRDCNQTLCPGKNINIEEIKTKVIANMEGLLE
ncbi:peptidoglycan recognition protein family protein [Clostridium sardiniense]|uniref:peptidoglycan recognition protein family protein n=1 Tax=Clostridium sardiniense TaxID=29369 RepID=UPI003D33EC2A